MREPRGATLVELTVILAILGLGLGSAAVAARTGVAALRAEGATADVYGAVHLTRARARATGLMHALVIDPGGRALRIVEEGPQGQRTVVGPLALPDGATASANATIRFSPRGFAVPFGTITVRADPEVRRVIVNILGRVRVARGTAR